jgi:acetyl esterase/lipase
MPRGPRAAGHDAPIRSTIHAYGRRPSQVGELFVPAAPGPRPVAVVLHGGFWRDRYDRHLMDDLCRDLAGRGVAAWNVEYRRLARFRHVGGWPETLQDVASAIDHLAVLAHDGAELDLGRVGAIGHSAGGHLALWAAGRPGLPDRAPGARPVVAVTRAVGQAPVSDLAEAVELGLSDGIASRFLGGSPARRPERYALASPRARLPLGVPTLLVHGERDDTVPAAMSVAFAEAAYAVGDPCDLALFPDDGHFDCIDPGTAAWERVVEWLEAGW